jgi:hypothetical protein
MGTSQFFGYLSLVEEYAFHLCEAVLFIVFLYVYCRQAVRHILRMGREGSDSSRTVSPSTTASPRSRRGG